MLTGRQKALLARIPATVAAAVGIALAVGMFTGIVPTAVNALRADLLPWALGALCVAKASFWAWLWWSHRRAEE